MGFRLFNNILPSNRFDKNYKYIDNTNPKQYNTKYIDLVQKTLTPIQEEIKKSDNRIAFCAAVRDDGFLPVHNVIYSNTQKKPLSSDNISWNVANCRNKRFFDDRTGLSAGKNTKPFLLQTYRSDMGGGKYVIMNDISAPIYVKGKHWGGLRIGYNIES